MITRNEIYKFANLLDEEYVKEIKPILNRTYKIVDDVLSTVQNAEFGKMRERTNTRAYQFEDIPCDIQCVLQALRYFADGTRKYQPRHYHIPDSLIDWNGYASTAFPVKKLISILNLNGYIKDDVASIELVRATKESFNAIRKAYNRLFAENNGQMLKRLCGSVSAYHNIVVEADSKLDNEFYSLFSEEKEKKSIRITVTIESM